MPIASSTSSILVLFLALLSLAWQHSHSQHPLSLSLSLSLSRHVWFSTCSWPRTALSTDQSGLFLYKTPCTTSAPPRCALTHATYASHRLVFQLVHSSQSSSREPHHFASLEKLSQVNRRIRYLVAPLPLAP
ncbi:hypothetical protein IWX92DRAFT_76319 [Phyllosticta citricarpa]